MVKKKLLSVVLVASTVCSMLLTGCGNDAGNTESGSTDTNTSTVAQTEEVVADDVEKPEKITIMVSGDFQATQANGQEEWIARWEELTGIELDIIQPDHIAVAEHARVQIFKHRAVAIGIFVIFHGFFTGDELHVPDVGDAADRAFDRKRVAVGERLIHKGEDLAVFFHIADEIIHVHRHKAEAPHDDEARGNDRDGSERAEAVREYAAQSFLEEI